MVRYDVWPHLIDFKDLTGNPGPRFWRAGRHDRRLADYPVVGICHYEAAAYARAHPRLSVGLHLDLGAHKSRRINRELLGMYDLVLVMENNHREGLLVEFPEMEDHIFLLSQVAVGQVARADHHEARQAGIVYAVRSHAPWRRSDQRRGQRRARGA